MSHPQSKTELAEAGRRKLEAFRKQKALTRSSQAASGAAAQSQSPSGPVTQTLEPPAAKEQLPSSNDLLSRAASELPVSTLAQPVSGGGSDEDTEESAHNAASAPAPNSQPAPAPQTVQRAAPPPLPAMRIPFTGSSNTSTSQVSSPSSTSTTSILPSSRPHFSNAYQSRLPPPPPVFRPPSNPAGQSSNPSPWRPAALNRSAKQGSTPSHAQPALLPSPVVQFHPAQPEPASSSTGIQQHDADKPSVSGSTAADTGLNAHLDSVSSTQLPMQALLANAKHDGSKGSQSNAEAEARQQSSSQLSLANERHAIPGVAIKSSTEQDSSRSTRFEGLLQERESFLTRSPASREVRASTPPAVSKLKGLVSEAESPDSPLVFPWSQGPNSTGAASGYASLSDSYLSRPPSQSPSQAPSPSKQAQRAQQGLDSASGYARLSDSYLSRPSSQSPSQAPSPSKQAQRAQQGLNSATAASGYASLSDSYLSRPPLQSPSQAPSPSKQAQHAQQGLSGTAAASQQSMLSALAGSNSNVRSPIVSVTAALPSPVKSPQRANHTFQTTPNTALLDSPSSTVNMSSSPSQRPRPSSEAVQLPPTAQAHPSWRFGGNTQPQAPQQQPAREPAQQPARQLPWEEPESTQPALEQPHANGNSQLDLATAHSSSSGETGLAVTQQAASGLRTLHKGSQASLADSLASGSQPAKASNFAALQQHIDDLTREKFELVRGLQEQQRMAASLAEENLMATEDYNRQAEALQQTRKEVQQLEAQLQEQLQGQEQLAAERDSFKAGAHAAADQSKNFASEVVALEEKVLQVRSREIRLQKETDRLQEGLQEAEKQLQTSRQDRANLLATIDLLQEEKESLLAKLRQSATHPYPGQPQTHAQTAESLAAALPHTAAKQDEYGQKTELDQGAVSTASGQVVRGSNTEARKDALASRLQSNAGASTSQRIADEAIRLHQQQQHQTQQQGIGNSSVQGGVDQGLARILHTHPGAAEQQQLLESIYSMIGDLESEKQSFVAKQHSQQAEIQHLYTVNSDLQRKLETQTQRLELAIQQQAHATPRAAYSSSSPTFMTTAPLQPDSGRAEPQLPQARPQLQPFSQQLQQTGLQLEPTNPQLRQAGPQMWTGVPDALQQEQHNKVNADGHDMHRGSPGGLQGGQGHDRYVQSAPPTPMPQMAYRQPSHMQSEHKSSGVWGWLGNVIAPRPKRQQHSLIA